MENYTLIGHPLGHSLSPQIHKRLFAFSGKEASYTLTDIPPEHFSEFIPSLKTLQGFNITVPHKMAIIPFVDEMADSAKRYQSVNCVANRDGKWVGYNTDCDGFLASVKDFPLDKKVLVVGCGGVGRMIAMEAALHGADLTLGIIPQDKELAESVVKDIKKTIPEAKITICLNEELKGNFNVIINATPVGMYPKVDNCPVSDELIAGCTHCFDVIYNPSETLFLQKARAMGKVTQGGAAMLVLQAVRAHEIWYDATFTKEQVDEIIKAMAEGTL